jgi:parallel beta-helix repeat protein
VVTCQSGEGLDSVLEGFTLMNGSGTYFEYYPGYWNYYGGGIFCNSSSPTIANNTISVNTADCGGGICCYCISDATIVNNTIMGNHGGGIFCNNSSPTITNNTINGNATDIFGGGISCELDSSPTITNNTINGNATDTFGGGISCELDSSPTIENNTISNNTADSGGGLYWWGNSSPTITNNIINGNATDTYGRGGGIFWDCDSSPTIENNTISNNTAYVGGGINCRGTWLCTPTITNNTIIGNMAYGDGGGGIYCETTSLVIDNNTITGNTALNDGGGISCWSSASTITNNTLSGNIANYDGGGIECHDDFSTITNNIIKENSGSGIYCSKSSLTITNNTIVGNTAVNGGGFICRYNSSAILNNSLFWNNTAFSAYEIWIGDKDYSSTLSISYSNVEGGHASVYVDPGCTLIWDSGNIDSDPLFVDPVNSDFHLTFNSPCKDTGDNSTVTELTDFEGDPRIAYGTVDMGADEFYTHLYCTGNATPGGNVQAKFVGLPGTSPVGLCIGTGVLDPPIPSIWGDWYLQFPILGPIDLGKIPSPNGVLIIPGTIPGTPPPPYSIPMQALIGGELTNLAILEVK